MPAPVFNTSQTPCRSTQELSVGHLGPTRDTVTEGIAIYLSFKKYDVSKLPTETLASL